MHHHLPFIQNPVSLRINCGFINIDFSAFFTRGRLVCLPCYILIEFALLFFFVLFFLCKFLLAFLEIEVRFPHETAPLK